MTKGSSANSDRPTNCLRLLDFENRDFGDLYQLAVTLPGFVRVTFHKEKECHIAFNTLQQSKAALEWLSRNAGQVNVFYAPPQGGGSMTQTADPSSVLYVRLMHGMTTTSLQKIVEDYEGLEMMKPAENHVKLFFSSIDTATAGSERLFRETNIYAFFHHGCGPGGSPNNLPGGPRTLHVTKLDRDMADLRAYMMDRLPSLERIGFHDGYVFCCFLDHDSAKVSRKIILNETRMKARLVEFQYVPHFQPTPLGSMGSTIRLDYNTIKPTGDEMLKFFGAYPGFAHIETRDKCCFATFRTPQQAKAALEDLNGTTNLKAVYRSRDANDKSTSTPTTAAARRSQSSSALNILGQQQLQHQTPLRRPSLSTAGLTYSNYPPSGATTPTRAMAPYPLKHPSAASRSIYDYTLQQHVPMRNFWSVLVDDFSSSDYHDEHEGVYDRFHGNGHTPDDDHGVIVFNGTRNGEVVHEGQNFKSSNSKEDSSIRKKRVEYTPLASYTLPTPPPSSSSVASTPTRHKSTNSASSCGSSNGNYSESAAGGQHSPLLSQSKLYSKNRSTSPQSQHEEEDDENLVPGLPPRAIRRRAKKPSLPTI
ncbi:hypothetical protein SeMB42_g01181 [Synchytrium endobioticum]|uniref:RRM domain-containing protein n=1 Tax=Synchytrium endobioticum TaxID=286115 RepID=A0A507DH74_9FUNG|nr:hypothetical protein SeLEV6574_g00742 [Synchytrium endobioticum]TPX52763.1 hypothetical protein SeMB42_g01181 [Synchytrium endobioticum]